MDNTTQDLWQCYQTPLFLLTQALSCDFPFAVITAHNPASKRFSPSKNRLLDRQLLRDIESLSSPYRALVGAAPDLSYMEKSWAVFIDRTMALQLGKKFNQYAIYMVEQGCVSLVPCTLAGYDEVCLGKFCDYVQLVYELPDLNT
ncbi:DUF3293 domain-containing protein [Shewanella putrefaciens]|uniref:DUF3293 domain-containing protein n=1 Tax=Shewanella putrefaciens TaxID=24 RepID=UPI0021BFC403|nr:DUF3293 domain-containing protein [Shewanella putrefaciens]MCA1897840.1 DUF3293 domain-containing protein [Shewanella putrefaciens]UXK08058.1 DUF3293 domain-containing protein [Shewanella putrefaciens]